MVIREEIRLQSQNTLNEEKYCSKGLPLFGDQLCICSIVIAKTVGYNQDINRLQRINNNHLAKLSLLEFTVIRMYLQSSS